MPNSGPGVSNELHSFGPDADRAVKIDQVVRSHLADSITEIADAIGSDIGLPVGLAAQIAQALRQHPVAPKCFVLYTELVEAALREDIPTATACAWSLPGIMAAPARRLQPLNLTDSDLGPGNAERYRRLLDDEPEVSFPMHPVDAGERARAEGLIADAIALLDQAAPEIAGELRALVVEIILVKSDAAAGDAEALVFDGASSFYIWGAVFLNSARQHDRVSMSVALLHEATHGLLFGITLGAPFVTNPTSERFSSPLRHDPRPMDGLIHACYVLARGIDCLERLLASGALTAMETSLAQTSLKRHRVEYSSGLNSVMGFARFTPIGKNVFDAMLRAPVLRLDPQDTAQGNIAASPTAISL